MADEPTVRREVEVDDPDLSPRARELLTGELRREVGGDTVEVPESVARADETPSTGAGTVLRSPIFAVTLAAAVMIGVILSLVVESWWLMGAAVLTHALLSAVVVAIALSLTTQAARPAPEAAAELEREGVDDPERELNRRLRGLVGNRDMDQPGPGA